MLLRPSAGATIPPWSKPIEALAPEETDTPDPTSFPDDILIYLLTSHDEALQFYREDLKSHITVEMITSCPEFMELLTLDLAYDVFVPSHWTGIDMEPYHLYVKPGLPDHLKARSRPIRESLYHDAKKEFDHMSSYFYEKSSSAIASPLVVAPKATAPVALYHTSTYILTHGEYVTMLTDPRSFYGYAHIYGSVSCTSTRYMNTF